MSEAAKNVALMVGSVVLTWVLIEAGYFVAAGFEPDPTNFNAGYFNRDCIDFDRANGFLWKPGRTRIVRIVKGEVVVDQVFDVNHRGYVSDHEYPHQKPPNTKRVIVFGDSFTAGTYLETNWVDRVHQVLGLELTSPRFQFDSFAMDGGGLHNWHHTFTREVLPNYEFDAIIIAVFVGNLGRPFNLSWSDDTHVKTNYFLDPPKSIDHFKTRYLPTMRVVADVRGDEAIDMIIQQHQAPLWHFPPFRLYGVTDISRRIRLMTRTAAPFEDWEHTRFEAPTTRLTQREITERYPRVANKLFEIMAYGRRHKLPILLASIPGRENAMDYSVGGGEGWNEHQRELVSVAEMYEQDYVDGYEPFRDLHPDEIKNDMWLKYDSHWNQQGSDRFAAHIANYIRETWAAKVLAASPPDR